MRAAPVRIPAQPLGENGCQFAGLTYRAPTTMKNTRMMSFRTTMPVLNRADSLIPMTSTHVSRSVIAAAGRFSTMGIPPTCGAAAMKPGVLMAVARSVVSQGGMTSPKPFRSSTK